MGDLNLRRYGHLGSLAKGNRVTDRGKNLAGILDSMSGRMAFLKENSEAIKAIASRHKGLKIAVFGSVARGDDGPDSDIDFLVTFDKEVSVLDWLLLNEELEQFLKMPVDVVSIKGLKSRDSRILQEAVLL